jgi:TonB family protein
MLVWAKVTVDETGKVESVEIARGHPLCNDAAREALRQWRYTPTLLKGRPVKPVQSICGKKD